MTPLEECNNEIRRLKIQLQQEERMQQEERRQKEQQGAEFVIVPIIIIAGLFLWFAPPYDKAMARCEQDHAYLRHGPADRLDIKEDCDKEYWKNIMRAFK